MAFDVVVPSTEIAIVVVVYDFLSFASFAKAVWMGELLERGWLSASVVRQVY